ncbi:AMP-binding protein [Actinomadura flavalba]|uniref:AMP-binding protein n=1 Tax=Actinomadura flavalba TaxID=1120938 RepID=UPI0003A3474E|nr:AMP-binding protein [Actinomadura flavalba]
MRSLWAVLHAAAGPRTVLHLPAEDRSVPMRRLLDDAERTAARLTAPGRAGLLMQNGEPWVRGLLACLRAGTAAVPIALPVAFGGIENYLAHVRRIAADAGLGTLLVDASVERLIPALREALPDVDVVDITDVPDAAGPVPEGTDPYAVIQYTSGSTSQPKGVALTADNVAAGLTVITDSLRWTDDDCMGVWLPLFHDMGLFSLLSSFFKGAAVCLWPTTLFARRTREWLVSCAASPTTAVPMPNFAYDLITESVRDGLPDGLDLSRWRLTFNGAEPVQRRTIERFTATFAPAGYRAEAMQPCYGMAEATLLVAWPDLEARPAALAVDRHRLGLGDRIGVVPEEDPAARVLVGHGPAVPGIDLRIDAPGDGHVGEIQIRGDAVMTEYLGLPRERQPFTDDGWLRTGDLGFVREGDLYVTGRLKDMAIVHGRNYYAEDVEEIVRRVPDAGVRRCAALEAGGDGDEHLAVLVETSLEGAAARELAQRLEKAVNADLGPGVARVFTVAPRTIPQTSSGKVRRQAARELYTQVTTDKGIAE